MWRRDGGRDPQIIVGADAGGPPRVRVFRLQAGAPGGVVPVADFLAYPPGFTGGVRVAAGDIDGKGRASIIVAPGSGSAPRVRAFNLVSGAARELISVLAYPPTFTGGVFVAGF